MNKIIISLLTLSLMSFSATVFAVEGSTSIGIKASTQAKLVYSEDANVGKSFVLDGSKSQDDGTVKTFTWTQVEGPTVKFSNANAAKPTFTPTVAGTYVFELTVVDNNGSSSIAQKVTVYAKGESSTSVDNRIDGGGHMDADLRVLPTVNKIDDRDDSLEVEIESKTDDDNDGSSERLLPTVNKITGAEVIVRGWDPDKKESIEASVNSKVEADTAIKSAEVSEEAVIVVYAAPAKLFGIFNITINVNTTVDAEGRVKVKFPWYRFLVSTKLAKAQERLDYIFQNNETNIDFVAKGSVETQTAVFVKLTEELNVMAK